jgi:hypothetical protein
MARFPFMFLLSRRRRGASFALALGLWLAAATASAAPRVVAVGDVHGDLPAFRAILVEAGLLDASGTWSGGDAVLVQLGDLIDRGPKMRGTLDFAMVLEAQAAARGGRLVALLGNHEVMNMTGDLRYVAPENYAEFADAGSEKRRADAWNAVVELRKSRARKLGLPEAPTGAAAREAWLAEHPPGYLEQREAFGPGGVYGRWLRLRSACVLEQGSVFLHGGLSPALVGVSVEEVDRRVHEDLATFDADRTLFVAQGLILPFFDLQETFRALREELEALEAAEAALRAAADRAGKTYAPAALVAERRSVYQHFLEWEKWTINSPDGPLWFRGYSRWSDAEGNREVPRLLAALHVERLVVGHTVQQDGRIHVRFGDAVYMIDSGMLSTHFPGGRASALEIADGVVSAIYPGEPRKVLWEPPAKKVAALR